LLCETKFSFVARERRGPLAGPASGAEAEAAELGRGHQLGQRDHGDRVVAPDVLMEPLGGLELVEALEGPDDDRAGPGGPAAACYG
jgi:hypothetical protein